MLKLLTTVAILVSTIQAELVYQRGDLVKVQGMDKSVTLRVVGIPKDRIRADDTGVYVNDMPVTGFSKEFLTRFKRDPEVVREGYYFLMGERRSGNDITQLAGIFPATALEKAR